MGPSGGVLSTKMIFDVFLFFRVFKPEEGTWISVVSWRTQSCTVPLCRKKSMFAFWSVWKTRRGYPNSGRLLADHILQQIGSERSDSIREMHFWTFFCFFAFSNLRRVRGFQNIVRHQPSPAEARQAGSSQAGPSRAALTGRPYTHSHPIAPLWRPALVLEFYSSSTTAVVL